MTSLEHGLVDNGSGKIFLESLLNRQLHFTVSDGRIFKGTFVCTDKDGSAILSDTYEHRGSESELVTCFPVIDECSGDKRYVGLVVLPGKHIKQVELVNDNDIYT